MPKKILFYASTDADAAILQRGGSLDRHYYEPKMKLEIGFPKLISWAFEQTEKKESRNDFEKLQHLKELLDADPGIHRYRPTETMDDLTVVSDRCSATRIVVPGNVVPGKASRSFSLWVSLGDDKTVPLCLIEGSGGDSSNPYNYGRASSYTLLQSIVAFARRNNGSTVLDRHIPNDPNPHADIKPDETHTVESYEQYHNVISNYLASDFVKDPVGIFKSWGCEIGNLRNIEALYMVKDSGLDAATTWRKLALYGYALGIEAD